MCNLRRDITVWEGMLMILTLDGLKPKWIRRNQIVYLFAGRSKSALQSPKFPEGG
jgi:hypothetical protein